MTILERLGVNRIVLALSVARLGDAIGNSILFIILPLYVAALPAPWFHVPESVRVGILISLYGFVNSGLQPLMGALSDRFQRRKPFILGGLVLMGAGTFLFIFANRFAELVALRSLQGVGIAMTVPASMALMASATQKHTRGGSMGVYTTMRIVGFALGPLLGGILHVHYGFTAAFLAGTAFLVVAMILVQLWVTEAPARVPAPGGESVWAGGSEPGEGPVGVGESGAALSSTPAEIPTSARKSAPPGKSVSAGESTSAGERLEPQHESRSAGDERSAVSRRFTFLDRELLSSGIISLGAATFVMAAVFTMMSTLEVQFNERLNQTAFAFSVAFSALMVTRLMSQIPVGHLSDHIGRKPLIIIGLLLMAPTTALLGYVSTTFQLTGLRLIQGLASAGIAAPSFALAADLSKVGGEGRQMSIVTMGFGLGIAAGPLIAGVLAVVSFELPFLIGGGLSVVAAWIVHRYVPETIHRRRRSDRGAGAR